MAPKPAAVTAARPLSTPTRWSGLGADERVVWGSCQGSGSEPYDTTVDHVTVGFHCTCPSRRTPCKHALALLLMWAQGQVPDGVPAARVQAWIARRPVDRGSGGAGGASEHDGGSGPVGPTGAGAEGDVGAGPIGEPAGPDGSGSPGPGDDPAPVPEPPTDEERDAARDERVEKMMAGLVELDRWLDDRMRTGLADPSLARYATWDQLAARLVDAQAGSLANRIRRLAGLVGASADWHDDVLSELGVLHLLAQAGRRLGRLPGPLADTVATTIGWQVRKADVLAGVPDTDDWVVAGRSDVREDRIEVRRHWLRGRRTGRWALLLSFAAYQQSLDTSLEVGTVVSADLHRYPGPALRALMGARHGEVGVARPPTQSIAEACDEIGRMIVAEPWLDRVPTTVTASLTRSGSGWALTDADSSLPVLTSGRAGQVDAGIATLLAVGLGRPVRLTVEWSPHGVTPLTVHLDDRSVDVGPRADASFVGAS